MPIPEKLTLLKDWLGVRIPQWYNSATELFVEVSDENPLPSSLSTHSIDSQDPLPVDGDSVYDKDVKESLSLIGTFTGDILSTVNNIDDSIVDSTATNPKWFEIKLERPITTGRVGIVASTGNFSNVKIIFKDRQDVVLISLDDSANNTKYTGNNYPVVAKNVCCIRIEFHTADTVNVSFLRIPKYIDVRSRLVALRPDGTETEIGATTGGNIKVSLEEYDDASNPVRKDLEGGGKTSIGDAATAVVFTGVTTHILITADIDNTDMLYVGESNITSAGANAITFLQPGDAIELGYDDTDNPLYIVAGSGTQNYWKGALL